MGFQIFENVFGMQICDFEKVCSVKYINLRALYMISWLLVVIVFGKRMCEFGVGVVYLVKFIHLRVLYMILNFSSIWGSFCGNFWVLKGLENSFGMRMCDLGEGALFS